MREIKLFVNYCDIKIVSNSFLILIYMPVNTLLLVEDNELNRDMLSRRLERKGYVIQMAADGAQGVSMATELRPALILMDLSLPVMDGWEAIR